jgi:hypothetical protein
MDEASLRMTTALSFCTVPEPLRFAILGRITAWDPISRCLQIGPHDFWVARSVSVSAIAPGVHATVLGHVEPPDPRWIATELMLDGRLTLF